MISCSSIDGPIQTYAFSHVMQIMDGNFIPLIILLVWVTCFVFYSRSLIKEKKEDEATEK